jgi:hypothetical protein
LPALLQVSPAGQAEPQAQPLREPHSRPAQT